MLLYNKKMILDLTRCRAFLLSPDQPKYKEKREHAMFQAASLGIIAEWFPAVKDANKRMSAARSIEAICLRGL